MVFDLRSGATTITSRRGPTPVKFTELKPADVHTAMREIAIARNEVALGSALLEGKYYCVERIISCVWKLSR